MDEGTRRRLQTIFSRSEAGIRALDDVVEAELSTLLDSTAEGELSNQELASRFEDTSLPEGPTEVWPFLDRLFKTVLPHTVRVHHPRFIGHMTSALPAFLDPLARVMTALNQNVVKVETSRALTFYERQALAIFHRLVFAEKEAFYAAHTQAPDSTLGIVGSGGTVANLTALWCARNRALGPTGDFAGVEAEGLAAALLAHGHRRAVIVGSSLMHYSLKKAADVLGLGTRGLVAIPADRQSRVDLTLLRKALKQLKEEGALVLALVGIAGTTETGGVDPLEELADLAAEHQTHLHVDAAWGGPLLFSRRHRHLLAGIERADSVAMDGHKQLYLPMGTGVLLFKDPTLAKGIEKTARYIVREGSGDLGRRSLEGSRPATALYLHGALQILGRAGYEALIDDGMAKAQRLAQAVREREDFELLADPVLNIVVYRYLPQALRHRPAESALSPEENLRINALNIRLQETQRDRGMSFISRTTLSNTRHGDRVPIVSLRAILANPLTTEEDIRAVLEEQARLGETLS